MKPIVVFFMVALSITLTSRAQGIRFEKDSLPVVFAKAKTTGKPVVVMLDAPAHVVETGPQKPRDILNSAEVAKQFQDNFLCVKVVQGDAGAQQLIKEYAVNSYPAFLFFNSDSALVYHTFGLPATAQSYIATINTVLTLLKTGENIAAYHLRYAKGERSRMFLTTYITAKEKLGFYDNSDLINDYVKLLTIGEINTFSQMKFILLASPVVGSTAMQLTYMFAPMRDSVYKKQPLAENSALNTRIIKNSLAKAIATKDKNLAFQTASYAQSTFGKDYVRGQRSSQSNLITFYKSVKDTTGYLQQAGYFYDRYYMTITVDSAKRQQQKLIDSTKKKRDELASKYQNSESARLIYINLPTTNTVAQGLNTAAWETYLTGTRNQAYLLKAIGWSRRSIAIEEAYYNHDTLAHLLYQFGFFVEAQAEQEKAIALAKEKKVPTVEMTNLRDALKKMQQHNL